MKRFKKKPVIIDAVQWNGDDDLAVLIATEWIDNESKRTIITHEGNDSLFIETLEGDMEARVGDWIIRGVAGELYPCKPDIFEATYELAE